jgi:hypothetical protein
VRGQVDGRQGRAQHQTDQSGGHAATLRVWDYELWKKVPSHMSLTVRGFPIDDEEAKREAKRLLDETQAKAVIT